MRAEVGPLATAAAVAVDEIDVDGDPALEARWGDRVPVLLAGERELFLFHYRVDRTVLTTYLASAADQVPRAP